MTKERVCIAGATGHLGVAVVKELCSRRPDDVEEVVAVARNTASSHVELLKQLGAAVVFVDASSNKQESYSDAIASVTTTATTAISCLASRISDANRCSDFWAIDRDANIRFGRDALHKIGVRHLILVATFEGKDSRYVSEFSEAKEDAVDALKRECDSVGATFTVVRPNAYFKDLTDAAFDRVLAKNKHLVLGDGHHLINPVARDDVAKFIGDVMREKRSGEFSVGGPDVLSFRDIGVLAARVMGKEEDLKIQEVPLWCLRVLAWVLDFIGHLYLPARRRAALVHWMIYVSTHDAIAPSCGKHTLKDEYERKFEATLD